ncbi:MAG: P1 family peptidase [Eubacteriaceae bacterium]|jgi:L-aminopeptidase/D-esterase-like protein|nr:P1 family peptidase [Eubacteriaceae bacterium]
MKEIALTSIDNIWIGHADNQDDGTGCSVILCEKGAPTGVDVRGGGPASRETQLLQPMAAATAIHGVLLSGGSAFSLGAADGVVKYLAEKDIGFDTGIKKVPLVCQSAIFDLVVGSVDAYPDANMAYNACLDAKRRVLREGNVGAGMGATVGKYKGLTRMMKSGIGTYAVQIGELQVGAVVVVNALGDILDPQTGQQIAGLLSEDGQSLVSTEGEMYKDYSAVDSLFTKNPTNTTIGVIVTNAAFDKVSLQKIAGMAHNGMARTISPVHTGADGDTLYAMSVGEVSADVNIVGTLAARVTAEAILRGVGKAENLYGLKSAKDF